MTRRSCCRFANPCVSKDLLHLPGPDFVDRVLAATDRPTPVLRSLQTLFGHGRLAGTGYSRSCPSTRASSTRPGASFAPNPIYFDPENIVRLALEGGCNAVASTLGVLGAWPASTRTRSPSS